MCAYYTNTHVFSHRAVSCTIAVFNVNKSPVEWKCEVVVYRFYQLKNFPGKFNYIIIINDHIFNFLTVVAYNYYYDTSSYINITTIVLRVQEKTKTQIITINSTGKELTKTQNFINNRIGHTQNQYSSWEMRCQRASLCQWVAEGDCEEE